MLYSIIIPVYNRPDEMDELLLSLSKQTDNTIFEVIIVEDGSTISSENAIKKYNQQLNITYLVKKNTGPGDSRNYGMRHANGDYFILFDSDCILPPNYFSQLNSLLKNNYVDCFGGPDAATNSFSALQKAINFSMTSFITTGGIRGGTKQKNHFQPRSFNMGISKKAFEKTGGFGNIHPGEDPELVFRLWKSGFKTTLFQDLYVYHKRRIDLFKFYKQVNKFGKARPILDMWHPEYKKATFIFPFLFMIGFYLSIVLAILGFNQLLLLFGCYFLLVVVLALYATKNIKVSILAIITTFIQFYGYGIGYFQSSIKIKVLKKNPEDVFPELFFKTQ